MADRAGWSHAQRATYSSFGAKVRAAAGLATGIVSLAYPVVTSPFVFAFTERDPRLSYPVVSPYVPTWLLAIVVVPVPIAMFVLAYTVIPALTSKALRRPWWLPFSFLMLAEGITNLTVNTVKIHCGRPRPNFFALCDYKGYGTALASGNLTAYFANTVPGMPGSYSACLASDAKIHQARLSFPSGHSALSFCAMTYMALMMYAWSVEAFGVLLPATAGAWAPGGMPVGAVNHNVEAGSRASADTPFLESPPPSQQPMSVSATKHGIGPKSPLRRNLAYVAAAYATRMVLPAGCLVVAALVATSRIINYWHNFDDVTAGGFLGAAVSVACFWAYQRSTARLDFAWPTWRTRPAPRKIMQQSWLARVTMLKGGGLASRRQGCVQQS